MTAMVVYEDGLAMWPGTIFIILQHLLFAVLHNSGVKLYFFGADYVGFLRLVFHFGIAVMQVVLCGFWAHFLRRQALLEAFQRESLQASQIKLEEDMLARVEAERALASREAEARLAIVANHTSNGVVIADSQGLIEWVNPAFERMIGCALAEIAGRSRGSCCARQGRTRLPSSSCKRPCSAREKRRSSFASSATRRSSGSTSRPSACASAIWSR